MILGTKAPREALFPYTKGICFSYYYYGDFFKIGFGKWDSRKYPSKDCFVKPAKKLRRYHEEFNIPSGRLSIYIWYGDPSESILACLQTLDKLRHSVESLHSLHARIFVNDYDASVLTIDSELDVLRKAFAKIIDKMRIRYPKPDQLAQILELETMFENDVVRLRSHHLQVITETTNFWKARDGWYDLDDMFRIAESWASRVDD